MCQFHVGQQLFLVDRSQIFDGFQFDQYTIINKQVCAKGFIDLVSIVSDRNGNLGVDAVSAFA